MPATVRDAVVCGAEPAATDECLWHGKLSAEGDTLAFRHDLARQAMLELLSPTPPAVVRSLQKGVHLWTSTYLPVNANASTRHRIARAEVALSDAMPRAVSPRISQMSVVRWLPIGDNTPNTRRPRAKKTGAIDAKIRIDCALAGF